MNHYQVLGVSKNSSLKEIQRAYHDAARTYHPDTARTKSEQRNNIDIAKINEAWRVLKDPESRSIYDSSLNLNTDNFRIDSTKFSVPNQSTPKTFRVSTSGAKSKVFLVPLISGIILVLIIISTFFSSTNTDSESDLNLGSGAVIGDCVKIIQGPGLLKVPCSQNSDGQIIDAYKTDKIDSSCGDLNSVPLSNGFTVCLAK